MKRFVLPIIIIVETIIILVALFKYHELHNSYLDCRISRSKLENNKYLIENEESMFWYTEEDSVKMILPIPVWSGEVTIKDDGNWVPPPYENYYHRIKGTSDSITIRSYIWNNPFSNRSKVEIIFENIHGRWIATSCTEYDPKVVQF